jgi:hypothetical protein
MAQNTKSVETAKPKAKPIIKTEKPEIGFAIPKENYKLIAIGFGILVIGFILMSGGGSDDPKVFSGEALFSFRRITLAPIVVLIGFAFEIWAIMRKPKQAE